MSGTKYTGNYMRTIAIAPPAAYLEGGVYVYSQSRVRGEVCLECDEIFVGDGFMAWGNYIPNLVV